MSAWARRRGLTLLLLLFALAACGPAVVPEPPAPPGELRLSRVGFDALEGWPADDQAAALVAFLKSCNRIERLPDERAMGRRFGGIAAGWKPLCAEARDIRQGDTAAARRFFETRFVPHAVRAGDQATGRFTGYFEPELNASLKPDARYRVPLHGRPGDLVTVDLGRFRDAWKGERIAGRVEAGALVPYPARDAISAGALDGKAPVLAWAEDPVDVFFLHIQGSGRLALAGGELRRIGYAAANGRPYFAIGRALVEEGELAKDEVSMQSIRAWLAKHPERAPGLMNRNPSYVFFEWRDGLDPADGPLGAEGIPLTPERSLAVDRALLPFGAPVWLETSVPTAPGSPGRPYRRLMVAQDTGGAITGPVRGDIFFGTGARAGELAGRMNAEGRYFVLLPKGVAAGE
ncbi:MAG: murein transglycosylase A [Alphaproteobacteria bacterium]